MGDVVIKRVSPIMQCSMVYALPTIEIVVYT